MSDSPKSLLLRLFEAAVASAQPERCLPRHLPDPPSGKTLVIGAGKASAPMARAVETAWKGPLSGCVITRYNHAVPTQKIKVIEAAHPVPDHAGQKGTQEILDSVSDLDPDDLVLCLMSGGASALLTLPAPNLSLEDKRSITTALLRSGATISEINCVRKHLSAIKGGRLAAACCPTPILNLLISDVPGDDPAIIGSGPTVPDPTTFSDARAIVEKYRIENPTSVIKHLHRAANETPKPDDPCFEKVNTRLIAAPDIALAAAATIATEAGYKPVLLGDAVEGEARDIARAHAEIARSAAHGTVLLSGGETTVTLNGDGRGGPNSEYALALALALGGEQGIFAAACDTDGIDGTEDNAGAIITPDTLQRSLAVGKNASEYLANNNSYDFFSSLGDLVMTGPTLTNVNDFRAILIER